MESLGRDRVNIGSDPTNTVLTRPNMPVLEGINLFMMIAESGVAKKRESEIEPRASSRVAVIGDQGTGKSSLIVSLATKSFPENVPKLVPRTRLPSDFHPSKVPITIIDTSSSPEDKPKLIAECQAADAIVLTYACDRPSTLDRLSTYWLPELRHLEVRVPVIVVGCKLDSKDEQQISLEQAMTPIMQQFHEIETCIECSALRQICVPEVFIYAQNAVLYPTDPLFDQETQSLKPRCVRALKRIFILCDHDRDGALSDAELHDFQVKVFNAPMFPTEIKGVKRVVQEKLPDGVNDNGLTFIGFLFMHALFIHKGCCDTTWKVLRKFGYDNDIKVRDDLLPILFRRAPDQTVELTNEALEFLKSAFFKNDMDNDGTLQPEELEDLFSTAPENPWAVEGPYTDAAEKSVLGGLTVQGFLSQWSLMMLLDPAAGLANLIYIGYTSDAASAFHITRKRCFDRKKQQSTRNVLQCFVFGPKNAGKSSLLNSFIGKSFVERYTPTTKVRYTANQVELLGGVKKTLVMREIPDDDVKMMLSDKESLAGCDVAVFVHDSSDESSWKRAKELLIQVAAHGKNTRYEFPCLIVSAKDDLDPYRLAIQDSTRVSQDMGIETPTSVSSKLGDYNNIFHKTVSAIISYTVCT